MISSKDNFTVGEVALLVGVSKKTVRRAIQVGELAAHRFNRLTVRIRGQAVTAWLEHCATRARRGIVSSVHQKPQREQMGRKSMD